MKSMKIQIIIALLFIAVGIAAVSTNLIINGSTNISSNQDDFLVYFSDVKLNGTQNLSLVKNEKELVFNTIFSAVGDKTIIEYDVTNASKNYDATVSISCTESNNYLSVINNFDQKSNLLARSTRTGTLTVELTNAVSTEQSYEVKCTITGTAVERETQSSGEVSNPLEPYPYMIGNEITIANETFNIISDNGDTITMLAQYNLDTNYKQSTTENYVTFSNSNGWEYTPGPKEIDIQAFDGDAKTYVNEYISYLKGETGDSTLTGTLITMTELKSLGCKINDDYSYVSSLTCANAGYRSWLVNGQYWWTRSANPNYYYIVWGVNSGGQLDNCDYDLDYGVRPVITISKETLENTIITFTIGETTYHAYEGMTWGEWIESEFNVDNFVDSEQEIFTSDWAYYITNENSNTTITSELIIADHSYLLNMFCCFDAGSKVLMADGTLKNIEEVEIGDLVMSLNEDTGEYITQRVSATTINKKSTDLVYVYLSNGTRIGMRAYHPLLTTEGWKSLRPDSIEAKKENIEGLSLLEVGDTLVGYDENVTIVKVEQRPEAEAYYTYNLSVEGHHNYVVEGIVAHNMMNNCDPEGN